MKKNSRIFYASIVSLALALLLSACATRPEIQAKMDEFNRTIPSCAGDAECDRKWAAARQWTMENSDFNIRGETDRRIYASSNIISQSGIGVVVTKVAVSANNFQIVAELECFSAYSCPGLLDLKLDFNRTIAGTP